MSKPRALKTDFRAHDRWLVVALNLGPLAAVGNVIVSYALAPESCTQGSKLLLHLTSAVFFVLALGAVFMARRVGMRMQTPAVDALHERMHWMVNAAVVLGLGSALVILAMEIPNLILRSCD
jgi:hypothetical protein